MSKVAELKDRIREIQRLSQASAVLSWDQQCNMPPLGAQSRAEQLATLSKIIHEKFTSDEVGALIDDLSAETSNASMDDDEKAMARILKRNYDRLTKVPTALVAEEAEVTTLAHEVWVKARKENDFKSFLPSLEKIIDIKRQIAEYIGFDEHIYDALLDAYEPGMKTKEVEIIFNELRPKLVNFVKQIQDSGTEVDDSILKRKYDIEKQKEIANDVVKRIGYDFSRGRQDIAAHPFCTTLGSGDVRITTRFDDHFLPSSLFASMHEAGHAMYEQGIPEKYDGTALFDACSLAFHESQSRMWENNVGRSREFIEYYLPVLQEAFPESLGDVSVDEFYRAANKVSPSLIRVEADEVTYGLHIMLRFELEKNMLEGKINFAELPEIWNEKMREYLGITPPNDSSGVLQDVHWSAGIVGYFPTYALGNLIGAQLWEKIQREIPDLKEQIRSGQFDQLLSWLRANVHQYANKYLPGELIVKITGNPIQTEPFMQYLHDKYAPIYNL